MLTHVMIDLETMGLRADACMVSIGAVHFDEKSILDEFYTNVSLGDCMRNQLTVDQSTVDWWAKPEMSEARAMWQREDAPLLLTALTEFNRWLLSRGSFESIAPWGNGANFDLPILDSGYRAVDADAPWKFYNVMCFRTLKNMFKVAPMPRAGTYHNALDDAVYQVRHLQRILALHGLQLP